MLLKIEVTKEDIRRGCKNKVSRCPIARAIRRTGAKEIRVNGGYVHVATFKLNGQLYFVGKNRKVQEFVTNFDSDYEDKRKKIEPMSITLNCRKIDSLADIW
jgi:hypothetical protein